MDTIAFLVLRIVFAWMFLYPIKALLSDWPTTVNMVKLVAPRQPRFATVVMIIVMIVGAFSILFGIYAQLGGLLLLIYCLMGAFVHFRLGQIANGLQLNHKASQPDKDICQEASKLAVVGHVSSAQKNFVLAAVGFFFFMLGSGPLSLTGNLFFHATLH